MQSADSAATAMTATPTQRPSLTALGPALQATLSIRNIAESLTLIVGTHLLFADCKRLRNR